MSWKKLEIPDKQILSMTSEFQFNCRWKLTLMTGFLKTGNCKWYIMVFFWTNLVWRVFWYPFCVPYIKFSIFGILISAVGSDPPLATLIPEDQWFIMIKYKFYQKIGNVKLCNFFLFSVFLSALWETNSIDQHLFLYTICRSYKNTQNIKKLEVEKCGIFFYLRISDFLW